MRRYVLLLLLTLALPSAWSKVRDPGDVLNMKPEIYGKVGFDQKMNARVPLEIPFRDETGKEVHLGDYAGKRPLLLALVYYGCPNLCKLEINGILQSLDTVPFSVGAEFEVVLVSIDPKETPALAAAKRKNFLHAFTHPASEKGFHFLTGTQSSITALASAVGFRYAYDKGSKEYAHPAGVIILTPQGNISRYLFGIDYPPRDLRLALVEASRNQIGSPIDRFLLFCYHYDPAGGRYSLVVTNLIRAVGALTALILVLSVGWMLWRERKTARQKSKPVAARVTP